MSVSWKLSTSQQPQVQQPKLWDPAKNAEDAAAMSPGGGFGPVADDGYGVSYMISAGLDKIFFHVSSKRKAANTDSVRFSQVIAKALDDIKMVFNTKGGSGGAATGGADLGVRGAARRHGGKQSGRSE